MSNQSSDPRQLDVRKQLRDPLLVAPTDATGWTLLIAASAVIVFSGWWIWGLMTSLTEAIPTSIAASVEAIDCEAALRERGPRTLADKDPDGRVVRRSACKSATAFSESWNKQMDLYKYIGKSAITKADGTTRARPDVTFGYREPDPGPNRF
jgi:hypothetical protein